MPCAVDWLWPASQIQATIAAEGKITIVDSGITIQLFAQAVPALVTGVSDADAVVVAACARTFVPNALSSI